MTCGCYHFTRKKCQCRHFYAVVDREPSYEDFSPECLKAYEMYYGDSIEFTRMCDEIIARSESYGGLLLPISLAELKAGMQNQHKEDLAWYMSSYNDVGIDTTKRYCDENVNAKISAARITAEACSSSSLDALDIMANPKKQSAYTRTSTSYRECTDIASSEEDVRDILATLSQLRGRILGRKSEALGNNSTGIISSLPSMETARSVERKKPHGEM